MAIWWIKHASGISEWTEIETKRRKEENQRAWSQSFDQDE